MIVSVYMGPPDQADLNYLDLHDGSLPQSLMDNYHSTNRPMIHRRWWARRVDVEPNWTCSCDTAIGSPCNVHYHVGALSDLP